MVKQTGSKDTAMYTFEEASKLLFDAEIDTEARFNFGHDTTEFQNLVATNYQQVDLEAGAAHGPAAAQDIHEPFAPSSNIQLEEYYTDSKPLPKTVFRPEIYNPVVDEAQKSPVSEAELEKIAEISVENEIARDVQTQKSAKFVPSAHLNARGVIAVAGFLAVLALVVTLVIMNAMNIRAGNARVAALRGANSELSATLESVTAEKTAAWLQATDQIKAEIQQYGTVAGHTAEYIGGKIEKLPNLPRPNVRDNPDESSNWFDAVASWFNGIFA